MPSPRNTGGVGLFEQLIIENKQTAPQFQSMLV